MVVPNPGHARQTVGSPRSGGIGDPQLSPPCPWLTPFDVERHGVHVATYVDPHVD